VQRKTIASKPALALDHFEGRGGRVVFISDPAELSDAF